MYWIPPEIKYWFTIRSLAGQRLRGLPHTESGIRKLIKREKWLDRSPHLYRFQECGTVEFHLNNLPVSARHNFAVNSLLFNERFSYGMERQRHISSKTIGQLCVILDFWTFWQLSGLPKRTAELEYIRVAGGFYYLNECQESCDLGCTSPSTLRRWEKKFINEGLL